MQASQDNLVLSLLETPTPQPDPTNAVESWEGEGGKVASAQDRHSEAIRALLRSVAAPPVVRFPNSMRK